MEKELKTSKPLSFGGIDPTNLRVNPPTPCKY